MDETSSTKDLAVTREDADAARRVGEALAGRYTEVGQRIAARTQREISDYNAGAPELSSDLLAGAMATVELLARTIANGTTARREHLGFLRELAARRVHQGVSLDAFIRAYRVALLTVWDACAEEATNLGISQSAGFALARSAIEAIDNVTSQATEAYLREETRLRTQSGRASRDLLERLIRGQPTDPRRRHLAAPGLDPVGLIITMVARVEATADLSIADALQIAQDRLEETAAAGSRGQLAAILHGELVLLTSGNSPRTQIANVRSARERALTEHSIDVRFGVSAPSQGFATIQQAYREAALALSFTSPARPIVALEDLSPLECALVSASATTTAIIASKGMRLSKLSDEERALTAQTIRAFANADLNIAKAAEELSVHPNTVRYRLQQIATKTGHDPRSFAGLVDLVCILELTNIESAGQPASQTRL